jgi:ABC-type phosphate transport system substrate-binding protein
MFRARVIITLAAIVSAFTAGGPAAPPAPYNGDLAIIVNRSNPVDDLSYADLRKVFMAERRHWSNGRKVTIVMREPGQAERETVLRQIYRMSESDFNRYFLQVAFQGDVQSAPKLLSTAAGVRKFVFNVPGAIGYLRAEEADDSVKVIRVDGRAPNEPGYKLKL